jgi:predicted ABC-class ATPase
MTDDTHTRLRSILSRIDGRGYKAYKEIRGSWHFPEFVLRVDHVQGDPFASPSRIRVFLPPHCTLLPPDLCSPPGRAHGTGAHLARRFAREARRASEGEGMGKSGEIRMEAPGQEVLPQTALILFPEGGVEARFTVGLPAQGRRVLGKEAIRLLLDVVPEVVDQSLRASAFPPGELLRHAEANEDAEALRDSLEEKGLVAFVADGAILPRRSGVSQEPMDGRQAIPFSSPASLRVEVNLPNAGTVRGMGIPRGVTLIVGGGYHGKSTLLRALERGVYNHRPGDGRELVAAHAATVKIRAEDGRAISGVDISPFIRNLPSGEDTRSFSSPNASGSTSQAANIVEAVEMGARVLLVDEDTAATNFMIRDRRMQTLVPSEDEPITPFVDRVKELFESLGVSSVLVLGGSGDYLDVADTVITMRGYRPEEVTGRARRVAEEIPTGRERAELTPWRTAEPRRPRPTSLDPRKGRREEHLKVHGLNLLQVGEETIDLSLAEQIVSQAQLNAIGRALLLVWRETMDGNKALPEILSCVSERIQKDGLDILDPRKTGELAGFRRFELGVALNRIRRLDLGE